MTPVIHLGLAKAKGVPGRVVSSVLQTQRSEHLLTESIEVDEVIRDDFVHTTIVDTQYRWTRRLRKHAPSAVDVSQVGGNDSQFNENRKAVRIVFGARHSAAPQYDYRCRLQLGSRPPTNTWRFPYCENRPETRVQIAGRGSRSRRNASAMPPSRSRTRMGSTSLMPSLADTTAPPAGNPGIHPTSALETQTRPQNHSPPEGCHG